MANMRVIALISVLAASPSCGSHVSTAPAPDAGLADAGLPNGEPCAEDSDCASKLCNPRACCPDDCAQTCGMPPVTMGLTGYMCTDASECCSGTCNNNVCL
jgi:hypothetical protein